MLEQHYFIRVPFHFFSQLLPFIANENVQQFSVFVASHFHLQTESFFTFISAILKKIRMRYSPQAIFHLGTKFVLTLHDTRMKCHTRTKISFGLKTGMNSFRNDLCEGTISSRHHVNRCREIYGDGMNSLRNETHSGIM